MEHLPEELANKLCKIARQQYEAGVKLKENRIKQIRENEEFYYGKKRKALRGRYVYSLPVMSGFVDTWMSKIDDPPILKFTFTDIADLKKMQKVSALWQKESAEDHGNWAQKDRFSKKLACFSGVGIYKIFAESDPKYRSILENVDHEDFVASPIGGGVLENHQWLGQANIMRTKYELENSDIYNKEQIAKLIGGITESQLSGNTDYYQKQMKRYASLGLNYGMTTDVGKFEGEGFYSLVEWGMTYQGERYYLLFDYKTGIWIRTHKLKDVFESNLWPWVAWQTHEDSQNFWSKAPADDVMPLADGMDTIFNQELENRQKRNFGQRGFDPNMIQDASQLEWRPDGLVEIRVPPGKTIQSGIFMFETPELRGSIELVNWMNNFLGEKTGITPGTPAVPGEKDIKVGVFYGMLQQTADRLGLYNKSYKNCQIQLGVHYYHGVEEHLVEAVAIQIIGEQGIEWDEIRKEDTKTVSDYNIEVVGGSSEVRANEIRKKQKTEIMAILLRDPDLKAQLGPKATVEMLLYNGGFDEGEVRTLTDKEGGANAEILSEASIAIQKILKGKTPKINRGANTAFIKRIINYAYDNEMTMDKFKALVGYAEAHLEIARGNMIREATMQRLLSGMAPQAPQAPALKVSETMVAEEPTPATPEGTQSRSREFTETMAP